MHLHALNAGKVSTLKPTRPKGNVAIGWNWQRDVYAKLDAVLQTVPLEKRQGSGLAAIDPTLIEKTVQALFEYTPAIKSARLLSFGCEILQAGQKTGPNLMELDSAQDRLVLQVHLEHHLVVWMRLELSPVSALVRSKGALLDSIARATKEYFAEQPQPDNLGPSRDQKRKMVQKEETESLLARVPNAQPRDCVLLAMRGLIIASKLGTYPLSVRTIEELLHALRPKLFPTGEGISKVVEVLVADGNISWLGTRLRLEPAGVAEVDKLLSQP